jgi:hypothetical protein
MDPILRIEKKEGYLRASVTGENTPENIFAYLMQIRRACAEHACTSVLIEENLRGPSLDLKNIFEIVSLSSEGTDPLVKRVAYVDMNPEHDPIKMEFAVNVAVGLGLDVRAFPGVEEARLWLLGPAGPNAPDDAARER